MKIIKLLFALSEKEFEKEKKELGDYIRSLNDIYIKREIYFELVFYNELLENILETVSTSEAEYFCFIFGKSITTELVKSFELALKKFQETNTPYIYTYFYQLPQGEKEEKSVLDFMNRLDIEIGHYYSKFSNLDAVKLNILLELSCNSKIYNDLKFEDGRAILNGTEILSLKNIPVYSKNEVLQNCKEQKEQLDEKYSRLRLKHMEQPDNEEIFQQLLEVNEKRDQVLKQIHQIEMDILQLCTSISKLSHSEDVSTWRTKKARELVDSGDYEGALAILEDEQRKQELRQGEKMIDNVIEQRIKGYMLENSMKISILKAKGVTKETLPDIRSCYEENMQLAEKHMINLKELYKYASFLYEQKDYAYGCKIAERLQWYYENRVEPDEVQYANLKHKLGMFYEEMKKFKEAKECHEKALNIFERLAEKDKEAYELYIATINNSLGNTLNSIKDYKAAEKQYRKELEIFERLAEKNPREYEYMLCVVLGSNNLANTLEHMGDYGEAEKYYKKALQIIVELVEKNTDYVLYIAQISGNFGFFLRNIKRYEEAKIYLLGSFSLYSELAKENPEEYMSLIDEIYETLMELADL